jgi:hypothetical protein
LWNGLRLKSGTDFPTGEVGARDVAAKSDEADKTADWTGPLRKAILKDGPEKTVEVE